MAGRKLQIVFSGMIAGDPGQGGATWAVLQYVLGLSRLGHQVLLVEPISASALKPAGVTLERSINAQYFRHVVRDFGLEQSAALLQLGTRQTVGVPYDKLCATAARADLLINVSGMLRDPALLKPIPVRAYLDLDPAFVQLWHAQGIEMRLEGHTHFVTIGQAIGEPDCPIPVGETTWLKTLQPIVLTRWPRAERIEHNAFTTVGNWRGYGSLTNLGHHYGQKAHSLRPLFALPQRTAASLLLAMAIHPDERTDLAAIHENGWQLIDPAHVAGTPTDYQQFIQGSLAELGIAKSGYVHSQCGWFSDRSVAYLASGRPVVAQQTGFSNYLPTGVGLLGFRTLDDAVAAIECVLSDYPRHANIARAIAEEHFDSDRVLLQLLQTLEVA